MWRGGTCAPYSMEESWTCGAVAVLLGARSTLGHVEQLLVRSLDCGALLAVWVCPLRVLITRACMELQVGD